MSSKAVRADKKRYRETEQILNNIFFFHNSPRLIYIFLFRSIKAVKAERETEKILNIIIFA